MNSDRLLNLFPKPMTTNRRHFLKLAASSPLFLSTACTSNLNKNFTAHIVIIGGGFAGATAAKTIKLLAPDLKVTLIEKNRHYFTCPASNWVLGGFKTVDSLAIDYHQLSSRYSIHVIHDSAIDIDPVKQSIQLQQGRTLNYDRLIVSPGIDFNWQMIEGYHPGFENIIPHAWQAGEQTRLLQQQLLTMPDNGLIILSIPENSYRCPPGPYERASLIAWYCKRHKPKTKIILLDHKRAFSKQTLFEQAWRKHYGYGENGMIEWHSIIDNPVKSIDAKNKVLETDFGDRFKADVINYIPPQCAGLIAQKSGLTDESGWCLVNPLTSESKLQPNIHVIGDAAEMTPLPKSAFAANSQAQACAFAVVSLIKDLPLADPLWMNTCYSLITDDQAISVALVYTLNNKGAIEQVKGAGGVSQDTRTEALQMEAKFARHWYDAIIQQSFN